MLLGAEVNALMTIGVQSAIEDLGPKFEKLRGEKLATAYGLSAALSKRVADGDTADLFIGTREDVDRLIKNGKIRLGSQVTFASSGLGIAIRKEIQSLTFQHQRRSRAHYLKPSQSDVGIPPRAVRLAFYSQK